MRARLRAAAILFVGASACGDPPQTAARSAPAPETPTAAPTPAAPTDVEAAIAELGDAPDPPVDAAREGNATALPPPEALPEPDSPEPDAPILPPAPEPGSPEADAALQELLDESTLTQEEFDRAFRKGGAPSFEDGARTFGADDRPEVRVGAVSPSTRAADVGALARASMAKLETCYRMALSKAPGTAGSVTLVLRYDAKGEVESASAAPGSTLGEALDRCLASVAEDWTLKAAAGAEVRVPLTLSG